MKRNDLIRVIRRQSRAAGLSFDIVREGSEHEIWQVGDTTISMPGHREISSGVARRILKVIEDELEGR